MVHVKTLKFLASREVFYYCYKIDENFAFLSYKYCMCHKYQGCVRGPVAERSYCRACRICCHYSVGELHYIKSNSFMLEKFYQNLLKDLLEILSIDPYLCF